MEKQKVLIVDDDHDIVRGLSCRLNAAGYVTITHTMERRH